MHVSKIRSAIAGSITMLLLFGMSSASGQAAPATSELGLRAQTGDAAFNLGWNTLKYDGITGSKSGTLLGGAAGYNATEHIAAVGEYQYLVQGDVNGVSSSGKLYGGLLRYSIATGRVAPYLIAGGGGMREAGGEYGQSRNADGWYAAFGGGASVFLTHNWGLRPEFRFNRTSLLAGTTTTHGELYQLSGGLFFQFGKGMPKASRTSSSSSLRSLTDDKLEKP